MQPCTTYQWSLRRVPYTTYRPVYQTQTVQMPVTAGTGCSTCNIAGTQPTLANSYAYDPNQVYGQSAYGSVYGSATPAQPGFGSTYGYDPYGIPSGGIQGGVPADQMPTLPNSGVESSRPPLPDYDAEGNPIGNSIIQGDGQSSRLQQDLIQRQQSALGTGDGSRMPRRIDSGTDQIRQHSPLNDPRPNLRQEQPAAAPPLLPEQRNTADVRLHRPWDYSPVRYASYQEPVPSTPRSMMRNVDTGSVSRDASHEIRNEGWSSLNSNR